MKSEVSPRARVQKVWSYLVNDGSAVIREIPSILSLCLITAPISFLSPSLFLSPLFLSCTSDTRVRYRIFASVTDMNERRHELWSWMGQKHFVKLKNMAGVQCTLAWNYIRDFFPSIHRSSAMRHRLAELFPRKILAIFTCTFFSREMAHVLNRDWLTVPPFRHFPFFMP